MVWSPLAFSQFRGSKAAKDWWRNKGQSSLERDRQGRRKKRKRMAANDADPRIQHFFLQFSRGNYEVGLTQCHLSCLAIFLFLLIAFMPILWAKDCIYWQGCSCHKLSKVSSRLVSLAVYLAPSLLSGLARDFMSFAAPSLDLPASSFFWPNGRGQIEGMHFWDDGNDFLQNGARKGAFSYCTLATKYILFNWDATGTALEIYWLTIHTVNKKVQNINSHWQCQSYMWIGMKWYFKGQNKGTVYWVFKNTVSKRRWSVSCSLVTVTWSTKFFHGVA